jgi:amino acid adenylation domain-containing protein/non-ribosomal peptide synthase protein (TIGR01720 family)
VSKPHSQETARQEMQHNGDIFMYSLSSVQQEIWFDQLLHPSIPLYNIGGYIRIDGPINPAIFEQAVSQVINRNDSLRTTLHEGTPLPQQAFPKKFQFELLTHDFSQKNEPQMNAIQWMRHEFSKPFQLYGKVLFRYSLLKISPDCYYWFFCYHHLITDGWGILLILRQTANAYNKLTIPDTDISYNPMSFSYIDFIQDDLQYMDSAKFKQHKQYWLDKFTNKPVRLNPRPYVSNYKQKTIPSSIAHLWLEHGFFQRLSRYAKENNFSIFHIMIGALYCYFTRTTQAGELLIGLPVLNRGTKAFKQTAGLFTSVIPARFRFGSDLNFTELMTAIAKELRKDYRNQRFPVSKLNRHRNTPKGDRNLFDITLSYEQFDFNVSFNGSPIEVVTLLNGFEQNALAIFVREFHAGQDVRIDFAYNLAAINEQEIEDLKARFALLLREVLAHPDRRVNELDIIPEDERRKLLFQLNDTETRYPSDTSIHQLFEQQVEKSFDHVAVVSKETHVTYGVINEEANTLAYYLKNNYNLRSGDIAGIITDRNQWMVIAILSILKASAAYLPIDYDYPPKRISYMLKDSSAKVLLTNRDLTGITVSISDWDGEIVSINKKKERASNETTINRHAVTNGQNIAYVIYTSGSTGNPKGVMIEHRNALNTLRSFANRFQIDSSTRVIQLTNFVFDPSVEQMFATLLWGGGLFIAYKVLAMDIDQLYNYLNKEKIQILDTVPGLLQSLLIQRPVIKSLKHIISGGDKLGNSLKEGILQAGYDLHNLYGPTEATIEVLASQCSDQDVSLGKPIANTKCFILDKDLRLVPMGVPGELCFLGAGVARGYLNNPELTHSTFISPTKIFCGAIFKKRLAEGNQERLYRTGDLGRWLPNGNIEFLGRLDFQVKIRGIRVELAEIEQHLLKHPAIGEVAVIATQNNLHNELVAFIIPAQRGGILPTLKGQEFREYLGQILPTYMLPAHFVPLEKFPLTPNGKINRNALINRVTGTMGRTISTTNYVPPLNELEIILATTWQDVLSMEKIGIDHNFFEIGGDSIKAIQIASRLLAQGFKLEIRDLFDHPTIKNLSQYIRKIERKPRQKPVTGNVELTPIQKWFFNNGPDNSNNFNQSVMLYNELGFEEELIKTCFTKIIQHHDALRIVFEVQPEDVIQNNRAIDEATKFFDLEIIHLEKSDRSLKKHIAKEAHRIQSSIDLITGPLVKLALFKTGKGDHLLIIIHHLVIDGISWRILLEDLANSYMQLEKGEKVTFPDKTDSFQYWASCQKQYAGSNTLLREMEYWKNILNTKTTVLTANEADKAIETKHTYIVCETVTVELTSRQSKQLLEQTHHIYNTEINDLLLTALALALQKHWDIGKILVNLEGHGRENIQADIDINRTIGWFTTQFPILLDISKYDQLSYQIRNIKETLREIPNKGIGFGILRYLSDGEPELSAYKDPEINFNYLGELARDMDNKGSFRLLESTMEYNSNTSMAHLNGVDINGIILNGKLHFRFIYNKQQFKKNTIETLATHYRAALLEIIDHCTGQEKKIPTPSDYCAKGLPLIDLDRIHNIYGDFHSINAIYDLSPMQEGFLFHQLFEPQSNAYFEQSTLYLEGTIDHRVLNTAINRLVDRYDILRTAIIYKQIEHPQQVVLKERKVSLYHKDLSVMQKKEQEKYIANFKQYDIEQGFNLTHDPLLRFALFKIDTTASILIWSHHHIIIDGWCLSILFNDLIVIYQALLENQLPELEPAVPYKHYIGWLEKQDPEEGLSYWKNFLQDYEHQTGLPRLKPPLTDHSYQLRQYDFGFDQKETSLLNEISSSNQTTLNILFQTAWAILLQWYNNTDDVLFGSVVSGRPIEIHGIEKMVGMFINTIPIRIKTKDKQTVIQLIRETRNQAIHSKDYDFLPLADIQSQSLLKGDLIDHIMVFENYPLAEELKTMFSRNNIGFRLTHFDTREQTNYDLNLIVTPGEILSIAFSYNAIVYDRETIISTAIHFRQIIKEIINNKNIEVSQIEIITEAEKKQLFIEFNDTQAAYPKSKTIAQLMNEQVQKTPDHIAVVSNSPNLTYLWSISYKELSRRAQGVAINLNRRGVGQDTIVPVITDRSIETIIAIMGILKAGGAYLPIDPDYPQERIDYILKDCHGMAHLNHSVSPLIPGTVWDFEPSDLEFVSDFGFRISDLSISSLSYVIYTSGSTGKPKGVMGTHGGVINLVTALNRIVYDRYPGNLHVALMANYVFDASVQQIFAALLNGHQLHIIGHESKKDSRALNHFLIKNSIEVSDGTPGLLSLMMHTPTGKLNKHYLKHLLIGGEALPTELVNTFYNINRNRDVIITNVYGPTETTVDVTSFDCRPDLESGTVPIGKPLNNTQIFIIDRNNQLLPIGVTGEICISGAGLTRGYINDPEQTSTFFVPSSFLDKSFCGAFYKKRPAGGAHLYKTGDLARWLPDGNIEFLGRRDFQVKIRGFRIELGEIESQLLIYPDIDEAVVIPKKSSRNGHKELVAFIISEAAEVVLEKVRDHLSRFLPAYMIPAHFIHLGKMPLTKSGKVDRRSLARLTIGSQTMARATELVPPKNHIQLKLADIWSYVLEHGPIGIHDNFFDIGGHSLKAMQIVSRIYKEMSIEIDLSAIFKHPTIAGLEEILKQEKLSAFTAIEPVEERQYYDVSNAQRRLWVLDQFHNEKASYNMASAFLLEGELNISALNHAFQVLIQRHESFRTSFKSINGEPKQIIHKHIDFSIHCPETPIDIFNSKIARDHAQLVFDLATAPLLKVSLLTFAREKREYVLLFNMHHIIGDGWSNGILINELITLYNHIATFDSSPNPINLEKILPALRLQYKDYALWQNKILEEEKISEVKEFWHQKFNGGSDIPSLDLPADYPRPAMPSFRGGTIDYKINRQLTAMVNEVARNHGVTLFMLLLAVVEVLLYRYSGQEEIIIGTPIAGRHHTDLEDQVGFYVNTLALRQTIDGDLSFEGFLQQVKQTTLAAYDNQMYPFDRLVDELKIARDTSRHPLFDTMVVLQDQPGQELNFDHIKSTPIDHPYNYSKFDLTFNFLLQAGEILMQVEYNTDLFKKQRVQRLCMHLDTLLKAITLSPRQAIKSSDFLTPEEKHQLIVEFNDTEAAYPQEKTVVDLFEQEVEKSPNHIAIVSEKRQLTFFHLNEQANRLAHYLIKNHGTRPDDLLGLMGSGEQMIIGLLAILKSGAAYVPIDSQFPEERIKYILADTDAGVLLVDEITAKNLQKIGSWRGDVIVIEEVLAMPLPCSGNLIGTKSTDLAYVIYTSGSTGHPKGVLTSHGNVVNQLTGLMRKYPFESQLHHILLASITFDASFQQVFLALFTGAKLFLVGHHLKRDMVLFTRWLNRFRIDVINTVPSFLKAILPYGEVIKDLNFKYIFAGGEEFSKQLYNEIRSTLSFQRLINIYGPTETTINATIHDCRKDEEFSIIPIGKPLMNYQAWIVDTHFNLQPIGVSGEICISGAGLARGYLNNPELTSTHFISSFPMKRFCGAFYKKRPAGGTSMLLEPLARPILTASHQISSQILQGCIYKTGDLGRWLQDGTIEYLGRRDSQVKVRGFRIELAEIESRLQNHPGIKDAIVIVKKLGPGSQKELIAFVTAYGEELQIKNLRNYLSKYLPLYMLPHYFVKVVEFPLTSNGKIDRGALGLLDIDPLKASGTNDHEPPGTETEKILAMIWQEVLGHTGIGIRDNFFEIGGDSIKAIQIASKAHKHGIKINISDLFKYPVIQELSKHISTFDPQPRQATASDNSYPLVSIENLEGITASLDSKMSITKSYSLSPMQEGLLFHWLLDKDSKAYFERITLFLKGNVDKIILQKSINILAGRHDILRTIFVHQDSERPLQVVLKDRPITLFYQDLTKVAHPSRTHTLPEDVIKTYLQNDKLKGFDLTHSPLVRVAQFKTGESSYALIWSFHHILMDGWCIDIYFDQLFTIYRSLLLSHPLRLESVTPYRHYIDWLEKQDKKAGLQYWETLLAGYNRQVGLPVSLNGNSIPGTHYHLEEYLMEMSEEDTEALNQRASSGKVTLNTLVQVAWAILLMRYNMSDDIVFGVVVSGRSAPIDGIENILGLFINTIPVRIKANHELNLDQLIQKTWQQAFQSAAREFLPLVDIQSRSLIKGDLFNHLFVYENYPVNEELMRMPDRYDLGFEIEDFEAGEQTNYDLNVLVMPGQKFSINFNYNAAVYNKETIKTTAIHLQQILIEISRNQDIAVSQIEILTAEEKKQILQQFNDTNAEFPNDKTIVHLWEDQVIKSPHRIAIVSREQDGTQVSYKELNNRVQTITQELINKGVLPGSIVAVILPRSPEMIIHILAILRAGAAYLPIDPDYPQERIDYILRDSNSKVIVRGKFEIRNSKSETNPNVQNSNVLNKEIRDSNFEFGVSDLSYVMYTSGSTGKPKGTMIQHKSLINLLFAMQKKYPFTSRDVYLLKTSFTFDVSMTELFGWILGAGTLSILEVGAEKDPMAIADTIQKTGVTHINFVPTMFIAFLNLLDGPLVRDLSSLKYLFLAGEQLPVIDREILKRHQIRAAIVNLYGPTEATVYATAYSLHQWQGEVPVPIGGVLTNMHIYILATGGGLQPIGVPGELCIAGSGIARGYLNNPELTHDKFKLSQFKSNLTQSQMRLYHTNDLARWLPDGNIQFLGRIDRQVKIRGFRIEPGEIEHCLMEHIHIKEAVVIDIDDNVSGKYLCAYMVTAKPLDSNTLKPFLSQRLPDYMVPARFVNLVKMPLNTTGKVARNELPHPTVSNPNESYAYVAPQNEIETILVTIWQEVLGQKKIGTNDNFFEIGGDSIKAIQILSRAYKHSIKLELKDLFNYPIIKTLAQMAGKIQRKPSQCITSGEVKQTPIQKWFFQIPTINHNHFNQAIMLFKKEGFNSHLVETCFNKIITHHDALRMVYIHPPHSPHNRQQYNRGIEGELFHMETLNLTGTSSQIEEVIEKEADRVQSSINLHSGPLVKLMLFKTPVGDHLLMVIHHLVIDGVSWRILMEDFKIAYQKLQKGEPIILQDKSDSFQYWAQKQEEYAQGKRIKRELETWNKILTSAISPLPRDENLNEELHSFYDHQTVVLDFSHRQTQQLLQHTHHAYNTEINDLLLTALGLAMKRMWGLEKILVNLEGHGREEIIEDIDINRTIGWFTTQFPVLLNVSKYDNLSYQIRYIKESLRRIPNKGIGFGILKYLSPYRSLLAPHEHPAISFNYLGEFREEKNNGNELFTFSRLNTGNSSDPRMAYYYLLNINGLLINNALQFHFAYNPSHYNENTLMKLTALFKTALLEIIEHCMYINSPLQTPTDYGYSDLSLENLDTIAASMTHATRSPDHQSEIDKIYALSPMQEGLLFHWRMDKRSPVYFEQHTLHIEGTIDKTILEKSINMVVSRHDILRTSFIYEHIPFPVQTVLKERPIDLFYKQNPQENEIEDYRMADKKRGFDLCHDPLMRFALFKKSDVAYVLVWSFHHILMDGWCMGIFFKELITIYRSLQQNQPISLQPVRPFKDYILWLETQDKEEGLSYWHSVLDGFNQPIELPQLKSHLKYNETIYRREEYLLKINSEKTARLSKLASTQKVTVNTLLQTIWAILLMRYNNTHDIVFGNVVSGRSPKITGIENILGLFINTIPVRVKAKHDATIWSLIKEVQEQSLNSKTMEYLPLSEIQSQSQLKRDLINHIIGFLNYPLDEELKNMSIQSGSGLGFKIKSTQFDEQTNYDLNILVGPGKQLTVLFSYNSNRYPGEVIKQIARHYIHVIDHITGDKDIHIDEIEILSHEEKQHLLHKFNNTRAEYPHSKTIVDLFNQQVSQIPDHIAVINANENIATISGMEEFLTYRLINNEANRLANYLNKQCHLLPQQPVGILLERSHAMMAVMIGILKAGGAYLPIVPSLPNDRIKNMVRDSNINVLIGQKRYIKTLNRLQWECENLDTFLCIDSYHVHVEDETEENELMSRKLWEYVGQTANDQIGGGGWISSYTGAPFAKAEMDEYADNILYKLEPLLNKNMRVLEIGVASGFSMFRIAPKVALYYGTDISQVIIDKNRQQSLADGHQNIKLRSLAAHDIQQLDETGFDLVILNSVIQCFNGHNYLRKTIAKVLPMMNPNAYLFLGDLMDQELKKDLIDDLAVFCETHKDKDYQTKTDLSQELFISRGFLEDLLWEFPLLQSINFSHKRYTIENELTKFRYDAIFQIGSEAKVLHRGKSFVHPAAAPISPRHKYQHDRTILNTYSKNNPNITLSPDNLAYIIYTSGSSGLPKGVMITHHSVVNLVFSHIKVFAEDCFSRISQVASAAFDAMGFEVWPCFVSGAALCIIDDHTRMDPRLLQQWLIKNNITNSFQPTMMAQQLLARQWPSTPTSLQILCTAGDRLTAHPQRSYPFRFYNLYGPTEDTVWTTWIEVPINPRQHDAPPPIGKPVANKQVYILSHSLNLQPMGTAGELCISGDGLARGYLNNPDLTSEKFLRCFLQKANFSNSLSDPRTYRRPKQASGNTYTDSKQTLYRTGDLARWLADGNIEFLGRIDNQVKIRGYRIELGEIENRLINIRGIDEAVVIDSVDEAGDKCLSAYIVSQKVLDITQVKYVLSKNLPNYMIPLFITIIPQIPLTSNGKIDTGKLPMPEIQQDDDFLQPQNETQQLLVNIWSEVLGIPIDQIGIFTNFFEIGGNSLKIMRVSAKLKYIFTDNIPIARMFQYPTIHTFAQYLNPHPMHETVQEIEEPKLKEKKRSKLNDRKKRIRRNGNERAR